MRNDLDSVSPTMVLFPPTNGMTVAKFIPSEIFTRIIAHVQAICTPWYAWLFCMHVCREWRREILDYSPHFRHVHCTPSALFHNWSKWAPQHFSAVIDLSQHSLRCVGPVMNRLDGIAVREIENAQDFAEFEDFHFPSLKYLRFSAHKHIHKGPNIRCPFKTLLYIPTWTSTFPLLRYLSLTNVVTPNLSPFISSHIRSLRLHVTKDNLQYISGDMLLSLSHLLDVLENMPMMEDLTLRVPLKNDVSTVGHATVMLPFLTSCHCHGLSTNIPTLFNNIHAPAIQKLIVTAIAKPNNTDDLSQEMVELGRALGPYCSVIGLCVDDIEVRRTEEAESRVRFTISDGVRFIAFEWHCVHGAATDNLLAVLRGFQLRDIVSLHLHCDPDVPKIDYKQDRAVWPTIFRTIPGVVLVTMAGLGDVWGDLPAALAREMVWRVLSLTFRNVVFDSSSVRMWRAFFEKSRAMGRHITSLTVYDTNFSLGEERGLEERQFCEIASRRLVWAGVSPALDI